MVFSGFVFLLAAIISAGILWVWNFTKSYEDTFLPGLFLGEYALEGLSPEQATSLLYDQTESDRLNWEAVLNWKGKDYRLNADEIHLSVDRDATLGSLWQIGRDGNLASRFLSVLQAKTREVHTDPVICFDETPIRAMLNQLKDEVDQPSGNATAAFDSKLDNPFSFTDEKTGYRLDTEPLFDGIVQAAEKLQPFKAEVTPTVLEPELYRAELENATGMRARVRLLLDSGDALENERLALSGLNGRMIAPGESLSFNSAVGNRVEEAGYVSASEPAFGPYAEGVGGGVCRIATMLYQAALLSGLPVQERHAAVYPVPYADAGLEAAVSDRGLDLCVKNDTGYPLWIVSREWVENEQAFAEIQMLGQPLTARYHLEATADIGRTPTEPVYIRDREEKYAVYSDERISVGEALPEMKAQTRLILSDRDGNVLTDDLISEDHYDPIAARIYVGATER